MILENCRYSRDSRVSKEAKALKEAGFEVSVISPESGILPSRTLIDGIVVYGFPHPWFSNGTVGYLLEYAYATLVIAAITLYVCLTRGFDILHVANPPDCIVPAVAFYKLFGKYVIYDQHDLSPELYQIRFSPPSAFLFRLQLLLERLSYKFADHTIVTNESYRTMALRRGDCTPSQVTVVRNGPDLGRIRDLSFDPHLRQRSPHILAFAGIMGYQDGLEQLCRVLRSLRFDLGRKDFLCVVLGDGDALPYMKSLSEQLGISENIWFAGWISDPVAYFRYLSTADICVAPEPSDCYNDRSTFIKVTEYMLAGKPIVAFDLPESRFSAGAAALFVTPNDEREFAVKLLHLMEHPELRRSMGECGRRRIEANLAWQYSIPALLGVYSGLGRSGDETESCQHAASGSGT